MGFVCKVGGWEYHIDIKLGKNKDIEHLEDNVNSFQQTSDAGNLIENVNIKDDIFSSFDALGLRIGKVMKWKSCEPWYNQKK